MISELPTTILTGLILLLIVVVPGIVLAVLGARLGKELVGAVKKIARKRAQQLEMNPYRGMGILPVISEEQRRLAAQALPSWCRGSEPREPDNCGDQGGHPQPVDPRQPGPNSRYGGVGFCSGEQECERRRDIFQPWKAGD